jgi:hypothetical protein
MASTIGPAPARARAGGQGVRSAQKMRVGKSFRWEHSDLAKFELARFLGRLGAFLTAGTRHDRPIEARGAPKRFEARGAFGCTGRDRGRNVNVLCPPPGKGAAATRERGSALAGHGVCVAGGGGARDTVFATRDDRVTYVPDHLRRQSHKVAQAHQERAPCYHRRPWEGCRRGLSSRRRERESLRTS